MDRLAKNATTLGKTVCDVSPYPTGPNAMPPHRLAKFAQWQDGLAVRQGPATMAASTMNLPLFTEPGTRSNDYIAQARDQRPDIVTP
jgi:hypothetical protein